MNYEMQFITFSQNQFRNIIYLIAVLLLLVPEEYDYVAWSVRMKAYLKACDLWDIVEAATQPPKPEDDEIAFNAWSKKDAIALYLIRESSSAFNSSLFRAGTAQDAWDILAKFYNSEGNSLSFNLFLYRIVAISLLSLFFFFFFFFGRRISLLSLENEHA